MRISFDIADTLVCEGAVQNEPPLPYWLRWLYPERLRLGTKDLFRRLRSDGHSVWIYTTSYRSSCYVKNWFLSYGLRIDGIVNQRRHEKMVGRQGPSKFLPAFSIGVHVDDSEGVALEGNSHGFRVIVVSPNDPNWTEKVLSELRAMRIR